ncbi:MAG: hypothetical protein Q7S84_02805 [bacterium]|nr:hypothetical protein [bacterium]
MNGLEKKSKEELLKTPIRDLGLAIAGSNLERPIEALHAELGETGVQFRPQFYFSTDWGCLDGEPVVGIPFYLAGQTLLEIEADKMKYADYLEDDAEIARILRHEAGHAFNYAYSVHNLPRFQEVFGVYSKPYVDQFAPVVGSDKFVRHLEGWYAQKHPDEDFAETFAVLVTPAMDWRTTYKGTPAYEKLTYVSELIKEYGGKPLPNPKTYATGDLDEPVELLEMTVEEWYRNRLAGLKPAKKILLIFYQEYEKRRAIRDEVVGQIKETLLALPKYSVSLLPINRSLERILNVVAAEKPDLIFNLCETFRNNDKFAFNITALLELMQVPFTGSDAGSLFLTTDKFLSKKVFKYHNISHPNAYVIPVGTKPSVRRGFSFPLFVKPVHEDASIGIDEKSLVHDEQGMLEKIREIHGEIHDDALVEDYIDGREFFVSVIGNQYLKPLEILELDFSKLPKGAPHIYTFKAKADVASAEYQAIMPKKAENLPIELRHRIYEIAVKSFRALNARDYARFDLRLDAENKLYILEANLNPYLARENETALAAELSGSNYRELVCTIVELAFARAEQSR